MKLNKHILRHMKGADKEGDMSKLTVLRKTRFKVETLPFFNTRENSLTSVYFSWRLSNLWF